MIKIKFAPAFNDRSCRTENHNYPKYFKKGDEGGNKKVAGNFEHEVRMYMKTSSMAYSEDVRIDIWDKDVPRERYTCRP